MKTLVKAAAKVAPDAVCVKFQRGGDTVVVPVLWAHMVMTV